MSKFTTHEVVSAIKNLASELGRSPSLSEMGARGVSEKQIRNLFGGYSVALRAAGLEPLKNGSQKLRSALINEAFTRDLEKDLNQPKPEQLNIYTKGDKMVFIPDLHAPWIDMQALKEVYLLVQEFKPSLICQLGDAYDFFAFSRFSKTLNLYTPKQEVEIARKQLEEMWATFIKIAPNAKMLQLMGNHCERPLKTLFNKSPELEVFFDLKPYFTFPGVQTIFDPRQVVMINDELEVTHGHWSKPMDYALSRRHSVMYGHTHRGYTVFATLPDGRVISETSGGHLSNNEAVPMSYTPKENQNWQKGITLWDFLGPRFIPF